jgi:hypothetical protein
MESVKFKESPYIKCYGEIILKISNDELQRISNEFTQKKYRHQDTGKQKKVWNYLSIPNGVKDNNTYRRLDIQLVILSKL